MWLALFPETSEVVGWLWEKNGLKFKSLLIIVYFSELSTAATWPLSQWARSVWFINKWIVFFFVFFLNKVLGQGCSNPVLEGNCPAEFSSNPGCIRKLTVGSCCLKLVASLPYQLWRYCDSRNWFQTDFWGGIAV